MPSRTVEDYLKAMYNALQSTGERLVAMGAMATAMEVTPGTATSMIKTLAESGLVDYEPRLGARLTAKGEKLALHVLRRHRLIEQFLVDILGYDWSEVDEEAEELEHAISDKLLERIDALLRHPKFDPHGDPIPNSTLKIARRTLVSLCDCALNRPMRIARVVDQNPQFLQFVDRSALRPGVELTVTGRDAIAELVNVARPELPPLTIGIAAAAKILVEAVLPAADQ